MVHAKTHAFQVLMAVALFCCLWFGSSGRVRAANFIQDSNVGNHYVRQDYYEPNASMIALQYDLNLTDTNCYYAFCLYNNSYWLSSYNITTGQIDNIRCNYSYTQFYEDGSNYTVNNKSGFERVTVSSNYYVTSTLYIFGSYDGFLNYCTDGDESGILSRPAGDEFIPLWSTAQYKPTLALKDFTAMIQESTDLVTTWNGVEHVSSGLTNNKGIDNYENTYVRVELGYAPYGMPGASVKTSQKWDTVYSIKDNGFIIPLADMDIPGSSDTFPDGFQLNWVKATPYYYANDDTTGQLYVGVSSVVFFDADGNASNTVQQAPTDSYDDEDPEQSIWQTIANFFGGFFKNLTDALYNLVVPDSAELMSLFQEINDWFSDRLGFIWYPFDLALQLVDALANGEANGMFKVPGLTLNMFDGVTLWNEFDVEIDQFGIFKYVRYFTSVLLVCGVAHMAIDKWDEWIGGHNI